MHSTGGVQPASECFFTAKQPFLTCPSPPWSCHAPLTVCRFLFQFPASKEQWLVTMVCARMLNSPKRHQYFFWNVYRSAPTRERDISSTQNESFPSILKGIRFLTRLHDLLESFFRTSAYSIYNTICISKCIEISIFQWYLTIHNFDLHWNTCTLHQKNNPESQTFAWLAFSLSPCNVRFFTGRNFQRFMASSTSAWLKLILPAILLRCLLLPLQLYRSTDFEVHRTGELFRGSGWWTETCYA